MPKPLEVAALRKLSARFKNIVQMSKISPSRPHLNALFAIICLIFSQTACAQKAAETISPEHWGDQFVAAMQSASASEQDAIIQQIFSDAALANPGKERLRAFIARLQGEFSPLEYHHSDLSVAELSPGNISRVLHIYLRKKDAPMWRDIQMRLDPAPPYKLLSVAFIAEVAEPVSLPNGDITQKMTLDWLDQYVQKLVKENDLAGSAIIAKGDQILFEKYFGYADDARTQRVDAQTLFNLGSGNKMFTALAIAKLEEQGKLKFTDKLTTWFPDFPKPEWAEKVTVHHLLSHTSGIREYWRPEMVAEMRQCTTWHQLSAIIYNSGFDFEPGTEAGYSNSNFILLGIIIEKVCGEDYFDFIQKLIYDKAGMKNSGTFEFDRLARPLAMPLARDEGKGWKEAQHGKRGSPAGGGYSTVRDMLLYSKSLKTNAFVSAETLKNMTTDKVAGVKDAFPYGYGFIPEKNGGEFSYGHGGIASGINLEFRYFPRLDITLVVFSNQDNGAFDDLRRNMTKLISGER